MSIRGIVLGLLGAAFIGATGYFNDMIMRQTSLYANFMPMFIYGGLIVFVVAINPVLRRVRAGGQLSGRELAVVIAIMLPACYVSSGALVHRFSGSRMIPRTMNLTREDWKAHDLLDRAPQFMLAGVAPEFDTSDFIEPVKMCEKIATPEGGEHPAIGVLRAALAGDAITEIRACAAGGDEDRCRGALADGLNPLLAKRDLFVTGHFPRTATTVDADRLFSDEELPDITVRRANRGLIDSAFPDQLLAWDAKEDRAVRGFTLGLTTGTDTIAVSEVPWYAWTTTLLFWIPIVAAFCAVFMGLAMVAHRRLSEHEHCPYPIVQFARALLPGADGTPTSVLRNRGFWISAGIVMLIHLNNYASDYWPQYFVTLPRGMDFSTIGELFAVFTRVSTHGVFRFTVFFAVVGVAYFMASDVSFSMGIAPAVYSLVAGVFAGYGISLSSGGYNSLRTDIFIAAGAYFGMFVIIVYTGRHHYTSVMKRALFMGASGDVRPHEVLGGRIAIVAALVFVAMCAIAGLSVVWAVLFLLLLIMTFAPLGRLVAETGSIVLRPHVFPTVLLWGFFGAQFIGPDQMLIMFMLGSIFSLGFSMNVVPLFDHGLELAPDTPRRTASFAGLGLAIAILVALPLAIYLQYDVGFMAASNGFTQNSPAFAYDPIVNIENRMASQGVLGAEPGWAIAPHWPGITAFVVTLLLILGTEAIRLRAPWWPIHPILFITLGWYGSRVLAISYLIGWAIKRAVTKYGGNRSVNRLRPIMFGLIAGDMLAGLVLAAIGALHYFITGSPSKGSYIFPR